MCSPANENVSPSGEAMDLSGRTSIKLSDKSCD